MTATGQAWSRLLAGLTGYAARRRSRPAAAPDEPDEPDELDELDEPAPDAPRMKRPRMNVTASRLSPGRCRIHPAAGASGRWRIRPRAHPAAGASGRGRIRPRAARDPRIATWAPGAAIHERRALPFMIA